MENISPVGKADFVSFTGDSGKIVGEHGIVQIPGTQVEIAESRVRQPIKQISPTDLSENSTIFRYPGKKGCVTHRVGVESNGADSILLGIDKFQLRTQRVRSCDSCLIPRKCGRRRRGCSGRSRRRCR